VGRLRHWPCRTGRNGCRAGDQVADLYAGAGLFSVVLADRSARGSVLAVERDRRPALTQSATDGISADVGQEGLHHTKVHRTSLGHPTAGPRSRPRGRRTGVMTALSAHGPPATPGLRLVRPASFGRDARVLLDAGDTGLNSCLDIFPMTGTWSWWHARSAEDSVDPSTVRLASGILRFVVDVPDGSIAGWSAPRRSDRRDILQ